MKQIAIRSRSTPSTGYRGSRRSGDTPRKSSGTSKSNAGPMPTRTASMRPRLPDGGGRTAPSDWSGRERVAGSLEPATTISCLQQRAASEQQRERILNERSNGTSSPDPGGAKHGSGQHQHHP